MKLAIAIITTLFTFTSFAGVKFLTHVKSPSPKTHVMKYLQDYVIVETGDFCMIPEGQTVRLTQYSSSRGFLRANPENSQAIECGVMSARYMKRDLIRVFKSEDKGLHFVKANKYYRLSSLAKCDFLNDFWDVDIWYDQKFTDFTTIIVGVDGKLCKRPSIRWVN